jgi:hypothetical protein
MNQVVIAQDQKSVNIGAGNRWGNVYGPLDDQNLAMVGGRVSSVGAAGLLTGGTLNAIDSDTHAYIHKAAYPIFPAVMASPVTTSTVTKWSSEMERS